VEKYAPHAVAAAITAILTLFDLDRHFSVPRRVRWDPWLNTWWWGFVLVNGLLAAGLYELFAGKPPLDTAGSFFGGAAVGLGYLALVRIKFTTFSRNGQDVPVGLEPLYEGAKSYFYRRINQIARAALNQEAEAMAKDETLTVKVLVSRAEQNVRLDRLLSEDEQKAVQAWIRSVATDKSDEERKRLLLITFILTDSRPKI
jgi:hypothetical protein